MTISIDLGPELTEKLKARAAQTGQSPDGYTRRLLERSLAEPTFDEILAPVRAEFEASGMTDEELDQLIEEAREEVHRLNKKAGS